MIYLCYRCKNEGEFYTNRASKNGRDSVCKECRKELVSIRQRAHPEFGQRYKANWLRRRPGYYRQYKINVRMKDPHWQVRERFGTLLRNYLKKHRAIKGGKTEALVGYSIIELREHLESLFLPGMSWSNYGEWHIDHVIPDSRFKYRSTDDASFKESWALKNLQPLWAKDNLSKGNKEAA